mmetsp:Transcript_23605/g.39595  ORF Transcript_23605/g.39595 Transcript_23605/m.39595 type:complete len:450 (-) Transcript_23605:347-1696(-)|eukprot:CAMPEP_0198217364 /NCGR_PEP_ID=MMETSP1445-20131203/63197_1 /TAXON_ID=36898 /ORGANISM="Pyramimonas sp., Strain CCMP2087" /LENGTH=449 /DNA_ID=CAMNT_0043894027 /DNA_START=103 /DNA_END=1452 /DNA_ORIENTATION=+
MADPEPKKLSWMGWGASVLGSAARVVTGTAAVQENLSVVNPDGEEVVQPENNKRDEDRKALLATLMEYIGSDVMSLLSIPVWLMEPVSTLQKMSEPTEFIDCLNRANNHDDPYVRLALVAAFFAGAYPANQRTYKPFNPILGETFESLCPDGTPYISEQVSHHPPIAAAHCENDNFIYRIVSAPKTKFHGNYLDILPYSVTRVTLKATGDVYALLPPVSRVNNLLIGRSWIDHFGDQLVINLTRGEYCTLTFNQCGWFSAGRFMVQGAVYSPDDEPKLAIRGKWNDSLSYLACDAEGFPTDAAPEIELWKCEGLIPNVPYNMMSYAKRLQGWESAPMAGKGVLSTDCRLRPDLVALREEDNAGASAAKHALEERQRAEKKTRTAAGDRWSPRWFKQVDRPSDAAQYEEITEYEECVSGNWELATDYQEHRATITASAHVPTEFHPWQYA